MPTKRRRRILEIVEEKKQVKVNELAELMHVSRETIRRDLAYLAERYLLRKQHGFAVSIQTGVENGLPKRLLEQIKEKRLIAEIVVSFFHPGDSLFIDTGTTTAVFAQRLAEVSGLNVFTNSYDVASHLINGSGRNKVYLLGGLFEGETLQTQGPMLIEQIETLHTDYAVLAIGAVDEQGNLMHYNLEEAAIGQAMAQQAKSTLVLADHTKFGRRALFQKLRSKDVDTLVTDRCPEPAIIEALRADGVNILYPPDRKE